MKIYVILDKTNSGNWKQTYHMVENGRSKKISSSKWFDLHKLSDTIVLPPLTIN